ncbi:ThiF family adenylyltransferase [Myxococcota bacterium]
MLMNTELRLERVARLLGEDAVARLQGATVAVFGLGGVGSYCAEALARSGVGTLRLVDHDWVTPQTLNRQAQALISTLAQSKVSALSQRLLSVGPGLVVEARETFFSEETAERLLEAPLAMVVDAIDSLGPKVALLRHCRDQRLPVLAVLGAGGRLDPTRIRVAPLGETHGDRLGMWTRKRLRRTGSLEGVMAVFSEEPARPEVPGRWSCTTTDLHRGRQRRIQPSAMMVPAAMGMAAAAFVVQTLARARDSEGPLPRAHGRHS